MFLLIGLDGIRQDICQHFNTSHVSINRIRDDALEAEYVISIHLMFLLIGVWDLHNIPDEEISIHLMFLLIVFVVLKGVYELHFNTSHVSINRRDTGAGGTLDGYEFQYISCFY